MDERHRRAGAKHLERRFRRRVAAANHDHAPPVVRMRLTIEMMNVREVLARHVQPVGPIKVADREHDGARIPDPATAARRGLNRKHPAVSTAPADFRILFHLDREDGLPERDLQIEGVDHAPVVAQRLDPRRLLVRGHEGETAHFQQFRCREKDHLGRKPMDRVDEYALLENLVIQTAPLCGNRSREARRPRTDDDQIAYRHWAILVSCDSDSCS